MKPYETLRSSLGTANARQCYEEFRETLRCFERSFVRMIIRTTIHRYREKGPRTGVDRHAGREAKDSPRVLIQLLSFCFIDSRLEPHQVL